MRRFRLLTEDEIECRIAEVQKQGLYVTLLLYKTARTDAALLDEVYGPENWQNDYKVLDGKLYCGIGVRTVDQDTGEEKWTWKWNVGSESNIEPEKGLASDAMKRSGFVWGIGAELYSAPEIRIDASKCRIKEYNGKYRCYDRFEVEKIAYDEKGKISGLAILCNGKRCYVWHRS